MVAQIFEGEFLIVVDFLFVDAEVSTVKVEEAM